MWVLLKDYRDLKRGQTFESAEFGRDSGYPVRIVEFEGRMYKPDEHIVVKLEDLEKRHSILQQKLEDLVDLLKIVRGEDLCLQR